MRTAFRNHVRSPEEKQGKAAFSLGGSFKFDSPPRAGQEKKPSSLSGLTIMKDAAPTRRLCLAGLPAEFAPMFVLTPSQN